MPDQNSVLHCWGRLGIVVWLLCRTFPAAAQTLPSSPIVRSLSSVIKADKARSLPAVAREALSRDGSVVVAGREKQFFALYDRNLYQGIPHFISLDPLLHLFHRKFDEMLVSAESTSALPALRAFAEQQTARALALFPSNAPPPESLKLLAIYHAVPLALLSDGPRLDERIAAEVEIEVRQIRAARGVASTALCPLGIDYARFTPRGHYDVYVIRDYFRAVMFYSECGFDLQKPAGLSRALDVVRLLRSGGAAERGGLDPVARLLRWVAGPADDIGFEQLDALVPVGAPPLPQPLPEAMLGELGKQLGRFPVARIPAARGAGATEQTFRLLGMGAVPDAALLQQVAQLGREQPSVLEVLTALGSPAARAQLGPELINLPRVQSALKERLLPPVPRSFYERWLALLAQVAELPAGAANLPGFMRTPAWSRRLLVSAAGSYAELRHDTLLYVKQPLVMREGGHSAELPASRAAGYVEPRPDVFRTLRELLRDSAAQLPAPTEKRQIDARAEAIRQLDGLLEFLLKVAELELGNQPIPKELDVRLRDIGSELELLTRGHADVLNDQALIADVLTIAGEGTPPRALHVGIGDVDELWVVVPRAGKLLLTRGGAFSYFEFLGAPGERLDDHSWNQRVQSGRTPPRPAWARPLDEPRKKAAEPRRKD